MITVVLVIHLLICIALVGLILLQRSEGGGLGMGGGGGGGGAGGAGLMSGRAAGNALTRTTGILAAAFFATSMTLALLANEGGSRADAILEDAPIDPTPVPAVPGEGEAPAVPAEPQAPIAGD
ncbi:Preprotein translocase subunit SecG [Caenispirillum salinarum AK4]|uniref:Protein-export membrane protein SecG n=1 Tax=Caenispirillum salinarum AK4 TaxID=1238182 RepID=K9HIE2_9PROT|nr:preprotein translocase subunit SecG [Caenispirillum salinarum]EKV28386.1 Preprotein translocase subunit SecG [Caenispirillum salinarum AK4]